MNIFKLIRKFISYLKRSIIQLIIKYVPLFRPIYETQNNESPITFKIWFMQKVLGFNKQAYWPVHFTSTVISARNVYVGIDAAPGLSPGCYIQAAGKIYIGDYAQIAPNVGLISANHFLLDIRKHIPDSIKIGRYCSIGFGSIIHPGVELGDFTYVGAGSVVLDSFPDGYCVIRGNPAQIVMKFDEDQRQKFLEWEPKFKYNGYIPHEKFETYRVTNLYV
jgi:acetyltransferase-like isoleucine patch superfamily enzyme